MNPIFVKETLDAIIIHFNSALALGLSGQADLANEVLIEIDELTMSLYCQLGFAHAKETVLG